MSSITSSSKSEMDLSGDFSLKRPAISDNASNKKQKSSAASSSTFESPLWFENLDELNASTISCTELPSLKERLIEWQKASPTSSFWVTTRPETHLFFEIFTGKYFSLALDEKNFSSQPRNDYTYFVAYKNEKASKNPLLIIRLGLDEQEAEEKYLSGGELVWMQKSEDITGEDILSVYQNLTPLFKTTMYLFDDAKITLADDTEALLRIVQIYKKENVYYQAKLGCKPVNCENWIPLNPENFNKHPSLSKMFANALISGLIPPAENAKLHPKQSLEGIETARNFVADYSYLKFIAFNQKKYPDYVKTVEELATRYFSSKQLKDKKTSLGLLQSKINAQAAKKDESEECKQACLDQKYLLTVIFNPYITSGKKNSEEDAYLDALYHVVNACIYEIP